MNILPEHASILGQAVQRIDTRKIWEIADGRVGMDRTRPLGERWHVISCPWSKKILEAWQRPSHQTQEVIVRAGSQTWKSAIFLIALAWSVRFRPGPKLWLTAKDDLARDMSDRIHSTLERSPDLKDLLLYGKSEKTTYKIITKLCSIDIAGCDSMTALEQNPYEEEFLDECRNYKSGRLQKARMRQRSYDNAKRALFSTPSLVGDEFDQRCEIGSQDEWLFPCQKCGEMIPLVWSTKYSRLPEELRKKSQFSFEKNKTDIWLECHCNHRHSGDGKTRRWILDNGDWFPQNTSDDPEVRDPRVESFHYPAMLNPKVIWLDCLVGFRSALANMRNGNVEDLKVWVNETLGEPWREGQHIEDSEVTKASYRIEHLSGVTGKDWKFVFQTNDVGKYDFWHVVRGWNPGAVTQILSASQLRYWADLEAIAKFFGLVLTGRTDEGLSLDTDLCRRVFIDARYEDPAYQEVHRKAAEMGWTCMIDTDKPYFEVAYEDGNNEKVKDRFLYSEPRFYDSKTGVGGMSDIKGIEFSIATNTAQDILDELLSGRVGKFEHPEDFEDPNLHVKFSRDQYALHMRNEPKLQRINKTDGAIEYYRKRTGPQHLRACEWQQVIAASMAHLIAMPAPPKDKP